MFKKLSPSEVRASIIPFDRLFMTDEQFEEFKKHSREHKSSDDIVVVKTAPQHRWSDDYTIIREAIKPLNGNSPPEK
jgi:hypothetical protein